ncbi:MAG: hypothetical protein WD080_00190, partial [Egibacteraceae bacterium]
ADLLDQVHRGAPDLDDLEPLRHARLAARCDRFGQVLVTAAVDDDVPLYGPRYRVRAGRVTR